MAVGNGYDDEYLADRVRAERGGAAANASIRDGLGKTGVLAVWLAVLGTVVGVLGFAFGVIALVQTSEITRIAADAARAAAKAETATARANTAEIYAYQVYTELNRLGYPVRTPAEDHAPQPPNNQQPAEEP